MRALFLLTSLIALGATAQPAQIGRLEALVRLSERHYNAQQPDSLHQRLTPEFKQQVSAAEWQTFLTDVHAKMGRWLRSEPTGTVDGDGFTHYKATFERGTLLFKLATDSKGQITGFGLSPYVAPAVSAKRLATTNLLRTAHDRRVDSVIRAHNARHPTVGLSVGLLRNDSLFVYGYGETAVGNGRLPDGNTNYEIGSISKTFTATLLANAVRQGLVQLDDPVNKHLPDSIPALRKDSAVATMVTLANHTSGLPRLPPNLMTANFTMQNPYRNYDQRALFSGLRTVTLSSKPGTTYQYSNLGVGLLGTILERKTGRSYEQSLETVITRPLGMNNTRVSLSDGDEVTLAQGHTKDGQPTPNWDFMALAGAGGIRSTVNDLLLYLRAELGKGPKLLIETMQRTHIVTFTNGQRTVGLGWQRNRVGNEVWLMHNGATGGYVSFVGFNPQRKTALVLLCNTAGGIDEAAFALIKAGTL